MTGGGGGIAKEGEGDKEWKMIGPVIQTYNQEDTDSEREKKEIGKRQKERQGIILSHSLLLVFVLLVVVSSIKTKIKCKSKDKDNILILCEVKTANRSSK